MTPLYQLLPISGSPFPSGKILVLHQMASMQHVVNSGITHYLSPLPEEQLRKMIGEIWDAAYKHGREVARSFQFDTDVNTPDRETFITNYLKKV